MKIQGISDFGNKKQRKSFLKTLAFLLEMGYTLISANVCAKIEVINNINT